MLPEDRLDILYHAYSGGGADINGPSVLVRKSIGETVSFSGSFYVDMVTSATIDVVALGASEYTEQRDEYSLGMDYLFDRTVMSLSYSNSVENDYIAESYSLGISQEFFGDLTTISLGFAYGDNTISRNLPNDITQDFPFESTQRRYKLGVSQVLTRSLMVNVIFETVIDQGYLNNPYRAVRSIDAGSPNGFVWQQEHYPETRNSDAFAIRGIYYLPYRASTRLEYRSFTDSWDITAKSYEFRYTHPIESIGLTVEGKFRSYSQTGAFFFSDLFPYPEIDANEPVEFRARDKEMGAFGTTTVGLGLSYDLNPNWLLFFDRGSVNFYWDHITFSYDEFRDAVDPDDLYALGAEPFYEFDADVFRLFFSFWY